MEGLKIAARYSFRPHCLGFCGPQGENSSRILFNYLSGEKGLEEQVRKVLKNFKASYAYYHLIARTNRIADPFDERVVRAYWIGNELLENVSLKDLKEMIAQKFKMPGKAKTLYGSVRPHHSFHVEKVGSVTGRIKFDNRLRCLCRISWGRVEQIRKTKLLIGKKEIDWEPKFLPKVKKGDVVSIHWNQACEVLDSKAIANLKKYTTGK